MEKVSQYPTTGAQQVADAWTRALHFFLTVLDGNDIFNSTFCRTKIYLIQKVVSQYWMASA